MSDSASGKCVSHPPFQDTEGKPLLLLRQAMLSLKPAFEYYLGATQTRFITILLLKTEGEISQKEIQKKMGIDRAMVTRMVKQMEAEGLVVRRINPQDNRFTLVRLSDTGAELYDKMIGKVQEMETLLLDGIDEKDLSCFRRSLEQMRKNAEGIIAGVRVQSFPFSENLLD